MMLDLIAYAQTHPLHAGVVLDFVYIYIHTLCMRAARSLLRQVPMNSMSSVVTQCSVRLEIEGLLVRPL